MMMTGRLDISPEEEILSFVFGCEFFFSPYKTIDCISYVVIVLVDYNDDNDDDDCYY